MRLTFGNATSIKERKSKVTARIPCLTCWQTAHCMRVSSFASPACDVCAVPTSKVVVFHEDGGEHSGANIICCRGKVQNQRSAVKHDLNAASALGSLSRDVKGYLLSTATGHASVSAFCT